MGDGGGDRPFQSGKVPIEVVLVSGGGAGICVLPESPGFPSWQGANRTSQVDDPQRVEGGEWRGVVDALGPPFGVGVDNWPAADTGIVCTGKLADPDEKRGVIQAIARRGTRDTCRVNDWAIRWEVWGTEKFITRTCQLDSTRKSSSISGPNSPVGKEKVDLGSARGLVRATNVICTTD